MKLSPWYPLSLADGHAPARPGFLQLRLRSGLLDYPRGKSAMVHYEIAADVRARAGVLAVEFAHHDLLCRHDEELSPAEARDPERAFRQLLDQFRTRFGAPPSLSPPDEAG